MSASSNLDGFVEILPYGKEKVAAPIVFGTVKRGRNGQLYVSVSFRLPDLDQEVADFVKGDRINVAYNPKLRAIRFAKHPLGKFAIHDVPMGKGKVRRVNVPMPAGITFFNRRVPVDVDVIGAETIIIDVPAEFYPKETGERPSVSAPLSNSAAAARILAASVKTNVTGSLMGDPPAGRSALALKRGV